MKKALRLGFVRGLVLLTCTLPLQLTTANAEERPVGTGVLFAGDPQIHNLFGLRLKQMLPIADFASKVAIRPPELNILAPLVFENLLIEGLQEKPLSAMVLLGDMTNIGCSGEFTSFSNSLARIRQANARVPVLLAHGNHDSYLMGTVNSYIPGSSVTDWKPSRMAEATAPVDEGWWGNKIDIDASHEANWRDVCYQPDNAGLGEGSPMNKSRWLAKYIDMLRQDGLTEISPQHGSPRGTGSYVMSYNSKPGSVLHQLAYQARGNWHQPRIGSSSEKSDLTRTYTSFLVQRADIENIRLVVIDTSVCENARGGWGFKDTNAGQHACIGREQFELIEEFVDTTPTGRQLVLAGHFPIKDLNEVEQKRLIEIASTKKNWLYVSAHTHRPVSVKRYDSGYDLNVGSTTDWPMEAYAVWFSQPGRHMELPRIKVVSEEKAEPRMRYRRPKHIPYAEVCRHLPAAEMLAEHDPSVPVVTWASPQGPACTVTSKEDWETDSKKLVAHVEKIRERFKNEPAYRSRMLEIAAAASEAEFNTRSLSDLIP